MQGAGGGVVPLVVRHEPQVTEGAGDALPVVQFAPQRQALLEEGAGGGVVPLEVRHARQVVEGGGDPRAVAQLPR